MKVFPNVALVVGCYQMKSGIPISQCQRAETEGLDEKIRGRHGCYQVGIKRVLECHIPK